MSSRATRRFVRCGSLSAVVIAIGLAVAAVADDKPASPPAECSGVDRFFAVEVWPKVGERTCLKCHQPEGDAAESKFLLSKTLGAKAHEALAADARAFATMARKLDGGKSRLLQKVVGGLEHGGGQALKPDSAAYKILERYVARLNGETPKAVAGPPARDPARFFEGVAMISPTRLLRRVTLSLAGRLPTEAERQAVGKGGLPALEPILDAIMKEEAFYVRLKEGFNDIFLTLGVEDNAETLLSYDHFEKTRLWYQSFNLDHVPQAERQRARWKLADVYREAILREPLELIAHVVRENRPITELATADYIMVSPYTARGYGIYDEVKPRFKNPEDPFEYVPARLKALKNRAGKVQDTPNGMYPHAGFLSMFHYLKRYPTTETNRNRLRARMFYQHFLGVDVMQLAPRVTDAAAVTAKYKVPTMEAADCVVCHKTIDPVAGIFQDYDMEGHLGPRKQGWYTDMFPPGFEKEAMPASQKNRAPQWLGERVVKDPRFPIAMAEHVYYILMGRKVAVAPEDIDDPLFDARRSGYLAQRALIEDCAGVLKADGFNLKSVFKRIILSDFYRADGLAGSSLDPARAAELDDLGVVRLVSPEQLNRKIGAIFGKPWTKLDGDMKILYGGIDSQTVTERNGDPSGAMGAIQRLIANDVSCFHVARDFRLPPAERRLFPKVEPTDLPVTPEGEARIRAAIARLHDRLLGQELKPDDPDVTLTYELFAGIVAEAKSRKNVEKRETYFCGGREEFKVDDPDYTHRAWRAVVTYLLRRHAFLYE